MKLINKIKDYFATRKLKAQYKKALKPVLVGNHLSLRTRCEETINLSRNEDAVKSLRKVCDGINDAAQKLGGTAMLCAGLAANQIGINARVFIARKANGTFRDYINPVILRKTGKPESKLEVCFSNKNPFLAQRYSKITIKADNVVGTKTLHGIEAWAFQHEMEHLEGIVYK